MFPSQASSCVWGSSCMSFNTFLSLSLFLALSFFLSISLSFFLSISLSIFHSISLSFSLYLSLCSHSFCLSHYLSLSLSVLIISVSPTISLSSLPFFYLKFFLWIFPLSRTNISDNLLWNVTTWQFWRSAEKERKKKVSRLQHLLLQHKKTCQNCFRIKTSSSKKEDKDLTSHLFSCCQVCFISPIISYVNFTFIKPNFN